MSRIQGWYYLVGGLWPFGSWRTFTAVAGPKPDRFQTEITGALFAASGIALLSRKTASKELLSLATALACIAIDLRHRKRIRSVFYGDALLNAAFSVSALRRLRRSGL